VTTRRALLAAVLAAAALASTALASPPPGYVQHFIVFITANGHGTVTSTPKGIACPPRCRVSFVHDTHIVLRATAAPGWRLATFGSRWCAGHDGRCAFDLVSPHDCPGGLCPIGAFGVRVAFVREGG